MKHKKGAIYKSYNRYFILDEDWHGGSNNLHFTWLTSFSSSHHTGNIFYSDEYIGHIVDMPILIKLLRLIGAN